MANFNLNKVILGGRLTADVELKQTQSGVPVCTFTVAVKGKGKDAPTDFIRCQAWRATAEFISRYFRKGSSICVIGFIQPREWTDANGQKRYATEVIVEEAQFVDSKSDVQGAEAQSGAYMPPAYAESAEQPKFELVNDDSDLPF
jgi:single-strand DNA-binding protein